MRTHLLSIILLLTFIGSMVSSFDNIERVDIVLEHVTNDLDKESNNSEKEKKELPKEEEEDKEEQEQRESEELDAEDSSEEEKKENSSSHYHNVSGIQLSLDKINNKSLVATKSYQQHSKFRFFTPKLYLLYSCLKVAYH